MDGQTQCESFSIWIRNAIVEHRKVNTDIDMDIVCLSVPPHRTILSYKRMNAYGNHYRAKDDYTPGLTSYDSGLLTVFWQQHAQMEMKVLQLGYVGELVDIWKLDYGAMSMPVILMKGEWVRSTHTGYRPGLRVDEHGFMLADFRSKVPEWEDPFVFPSQVEQAFFMDVEEEPGVRVVLHKEPSSRRVHGTCIPFKLAGNVAFSDLEKHGRKRTKQTVRTVEDAVPLTVREVGQLSRQYDLEDIPDFESDVGEHSSSSSDLD